MLAFINIKLAIDDDIRLYFQLWLVWLLKSQALQKHHKKIQESVTVDGKVSHYQTCTKLFLQNVNIKEA